MSGKRNWKKKKKKISQSSKNRSRRIKSRSNRERYSSDEMSSDEGDGRNRRRKNRGKRKRSGKEKRERRRRERERDDSIEEDENSVEEELTESDESENEGEESEEEEELSYEERKIKKYVSGVKKEHLYVFNDSIQEYRVKKRFDDGFMGKMSHDLRTILNMNREIPEGLMSSLCPGFTFIGMESSGKSSVVCGVVGEPLCDINQGVCTRVPSYITVESDRKKLDTVATVIVKHHGRGEKIQNYIKRAHSDSRRVDGRLNIWEGWTVNKKINEFIGGRGSKKDPGADKEPIHFNIKTPESIFPFFLIDMPGYVGANAGRRFSKKVEEINRSTVQKYVIDPADSRMYVCVCVEASQCMSIRRDKFTRIIGLDDEVKNCDRIIFIFTKCDLFFQKEDIETFLERFAEKGIETSHRGLWNYFTKDILKMYPLAEFFFSACPVLEGVYKQKVNQTRKYREAKERIQGELKRDEKSRYRSIIEFLRNLHKMKWRNKMEFRRDREYVKKFESRIGLHRLHAMIQRKSRLNDGVKIGEFVFGIMDGKRLEWKKLYDVEKAKLDREKANPSPAKEVLDVLKDTKKILFHLFTGRFLMDIIVRPKGNENVFDSLFLKEFMGSSGKTLVDMVKMTFPQCTRENLNKFERMIVEDDQDERCGALICIGDAVKLLVCAIPNERPRKATKRELNKRTVYDDDSESRTIRNYFLERIRDFSLKICTKSFDFIKKIWKLYLRRIYSSLNSMIGRHLSEKYDNAVNERWARGSKLGFLQKEVLNICKFVMKITLDVDDMLDTRLKHFQKQYLMVPTTYAQSYETLVNIGHQYFRIGRGSRFKRMKDRVQRLRKAKKKLERELKKDLIIDMSIDALCDDKAKEEEEEDNYSDLSDIDISSDDDDDDDDDDDSEIIEDLGKENDGVWVFKSGEEVYKYGTEKAGIYKKQGRGVYSFKDIHEGEYLPHMNNSYFKPDGRTMLHDGEYGRVEADGKFHDVHGGYYDILPDNRRPPLNFGDYHYFPHRIKKEEEEDSKEVEEEEEEEENEGEEEEEVKDPKKVEEQFEMMKRVYDTFNMDGLEKHICGNQITDEQANNFNLDLERVCHVISVNLTNQVYLFQSEIKNLFRPENYARELDFGYDNLKKYLVMKLEERSLVKGEFDSLSLEKLINQWFGLKSDLDEYQNRVNELHESLVQIGEVNFLVDKYLTEARVKKRDGHQEEEEEEGENNIMYYDSYDENKYDDDNNNSNDGELLMIQDEIENMDLDLSDNNSDEESEDDHSDD